MNRQTDLLRGAAHLALIAVTVAARALPASES